MSSEMKYNINKLHGLILNDFTDVKIVEKSSMEFGNYFEISINEGKEVRIILTKKEIENQVFEWKYFSNPLDEKSLLIERKSSIENISNDIKDIFEKNRFDEEYLKIVD
jgi:hypothetical protein